MNYQRVFRSVVFLGVAVLGLLPFTVSGQAGGVDTTFNAAPSNPVPSDVNFQQLVQPDGKVLVYGAPTMFVNGELRSGMFRLNADGSTDTTFSYNNEGGVSTSSVMLAPDGKIVIGGTAAPNHGKMIRLNSDGSIDNSFTAVFVTAVGPPEFTSNWFTVHAIQPDGKIIATHGSYGNIQGTWYSFSMKRYNPNGTVDTTFSSPSLPGGHLMYTTALIELLPDGRFYLALSSNSHLGGGLSISRRLAGGSVDSTYSQFNQSTPSSFYLSIADLSVAIDGGVLATGVFWPSMLGGPYPKQLYKYSSTGAQDLGFSSPNALSGGGVHQLPDGKVLYSFTANHSSASRMTRLNADGSVDNTYVMDPVITSIKNTWQVDAMNRPVFLATTASGPRLVRLLDNGNIDPSFNPVFGSVGTVSLSAVQPDGKVVVAGSFTHMNGVARNSIARVNVDGSIDPTFDPGTGFSNVPRQILLQPDGKILAVGSFISFNGTPLTSVARLNADGSLDNTFSVTVTGSSVNRVALQSDGKVLIGGSFTAINGIGRTGIARLESNGALDNSFNPVLGGDGTVRTVLLEPNGKIIIGGQYTGVNGVTRNNLARVDSTGATDTSFEAVGLPITHGVYRQTDGRYLITVGPSLFLSRRNSDGSPDSSFTVPTVMSGSSSGSIADVVPMSDGSVLIGGSFTSIGGVARFNFTRLGPNGALDQTFLASGANAAVASITPYSDGKVMVAGGYNTIGSVSRLGIARVNVPAFVRKAAFDFNGDGRADWAVYRPSSGVWYQLFSNGDPYAAPTFGLAGDVPVPADFDGDGKTDIAIFRASTGFWWYQSSLTGAQVAVQIGQVGDILLPSDVDGDGKADQVVYRPGNRTWYRVLSTNSSTEAFVFGAAGDQPVIGDFDGDGKTDMAVFRPSTGDWWYAASSSNHQHRALHWGQAGDIPAPGDFDGDGKTDPAVFRPSEGGWYCSKSGGGQPITTVFGLSGDRPVPADYDGDGSADIAVYRPSNGIWYFVQSTAGSGGVQWGLATDVAIPNAFLPQ